MTWNLELTETMQGWLALDGQPPTAVDLHIRAIAPIQAAPTTHRSVEGRIHFMDHGDRYPVTGTLRLLPTGPEYDFRFVGSDGTIVRCHGRKSYSLRRLRHSLVTCPLRVYRDEQVIGQGEIQYREPLWQFPLRSLRLRRSPARRPRTLTGRGGAHD